MNAEKISKLNSLGLTEYESKAILSMIEQNAFEVPEISRNADIPKTRVYDVLEKLEKKNLVVGMEGRPKKFHAIEPKKIIEKLIENKKKEFQKMEKNALNLMKTIGFEQETKEFVHRVKNPEDFHKILSQEILKAKKSVLGFTEIKEKRFLDEALEKAVAKNIEVKLISNSKETEKIFSKKISAVNSPHTLNAFIIDKSKIVLGLDNFKEKKQRYHFAVLKNKTLISALENQFKTDWEKKRKNLNK